MRPGSAAGKAIASWALSLVVLTALAPSARAEGRVQFLSDRLRYPPAAGQPDDFRVRTNAALALGSTNDDSAVAPLCAGLDDPSEVVRQAAAVGLKKLARASSTECLQRRMSLEKSSAVRADIERAIDATGRSASAAKGAANGHEGDARRAEKFFVVLSRVTNRTGRPSSEVEPIVRGAVLRQLQESGNYRVANEAETTESEKAAVSKDRLKGYWLAISVDKFDYTPDGLRVRVKIAVLSYPGKDLRGEVPAGATLPGARQGDKGAENELMGVVASRAAELFTQNFK